MTRNTKIHFDRLLREGTLCLSHLLHTRELNLSPVSLGRMKSSGFNRLRGELSSHLAMREMVRGQWNIVSRILTLISQRTGIHPGKHSDQLLIGHISVSYNGITGFLICLHHYFVGSSKMWGRWWIESQCFSKFNCLPVKLLSV